MTIEYEQYWLSSPYSNSFPLQSFQFDHVVTIKLIFLTHFTSLIHSTSNSNSYLNTSDLLCGDLINVSDCIYLKILISTQRVSWDSCQQEMDVSHPFYKSYPYMCTRNCNLILNVSNCSCGELINVSIEIYLAILLEITGHFK